MAAGEFPSALVRLLGLRTWICWKWGRSKKARADAPMTKIPCDLGGRAMSSADVANLRLYSDVYDSVSHHVTSGAALALCGNDGSFLVLDLDKCRDTSTGAIADWAMGLVEAAGSYTEVSPSGTGLRIIGGSGGWDGSNQRRWWMGAEAERGGYGGKGETFFRTGFATVTFQALPGYAGKWSDIGALAASLGKRPEDRSAAGAGDSTGTHVPGKAEAPIEVVRETLMELPNDGASSWEWWNKVGMIVFRATGGADEGLEAWTEWSQVHESYGIEDTCEARWEHWSDSSPPGRLGYGSLHRMVRETKTMAGVVGWDGGPAYRAYRGPAAAAAGVGMGPLPGGTNPAPGTSADPSPVGGANGANSSVGGVVSSNGNVGAGVGGGGNLPLFSDEMLARRMVDTWGSDLRYVAGWGKWMRWKVTPEGGGTWREDTVLETMLMARATCAAAADDMPKLAPGLLSAKTIRATEGLARSDARVAATTDQWDTDPWVLNTPGGALDLRGGGLKGAGRDSHATKITTVIPNFEGDCPMWMNFLGSVTGGDKDLEAYLGRVFGYCLTGDVSEHALFFLFGEGGNGKGTFLNTMTWLLGVGEYARHAGAETFTASRGESHLTEIARLRGSRLVVTTEVESNKAWAEARIKMLTGGDTVAARFMHQDHFEFKPEFKLVFSGNSKPRVQSVNEAMRRRMNIIPFNVKIPDSDKDLQLGEKLKSEGGAILAWAVRGCREWQRIGLAAPASVTGATQGYMADEDVHMAWLAECCRDTRGEARPQPVETRIGEIFTSWRVWAEMSKEEAGSIRALTDWLREQKFEIVKDKLDRTVVRGLCTLTGNTQTNIPAITENDKKVIQFPTPWAPEKT